MRTRRSPRRIALRAEGHPLSLRDRIRAYLGVDALQRIEETMATEFLTMLQGIAAQTSELTATQQASFVNIHNAINRQTQQITDLRQQLTDALQNQGKVTPEMQAKADEIAQSLADLKKGAETADDGFEPVEEPTEPAPGDETPTVPTESTDPNGNVPAPGDGDVSGTFRR